MLEYTQTIYVNNNVTKLEPLEYIQAKEIIQQHNQTNNIFQIIILTTLIIIIIIVILYFIYKYKTLPQKLIVKFKNQTLKNENIISPKTDNIAPPNTPVLYPNLNA